MSILLSWLIELQDVYMYIVTQFINDTLHEMELSSTQVIAVLFIFYLALFATLKYIAKEVCPVYISAAYSLVVVYCSIVYSYSSDIATNHGRIMQNLVLVYIPFIFLILSTSIFCLIDIVRENIEYKSYNKHSDK